ncbi:AAA-like domain-containing protein [Nostoc sp.]|uniref:AAA-like domain-containing protein n=1 Tax=Nostoc sp. TaxID=1180 RepID=UPI002FFAB590
MNFEETRKVVEAAIQAREHRHLNDVELTILRGSWEGLTYDEMAKGSLYEANYLKGDAGYRFWKLLSEVLGELVSKRNFRGVVERSQFTYKDATPTQSVNLASDFYYVERPPIESLCQEEILIPGALLRIKAPPKMGKTELMSRLINYATNQGYRGVDLKLRLAEETDFESLDKFLQWFCSSITQMLEIKLDNKVNELWDQQLGNSKLKCMAYFEDYLLVDEDKSSLVLGLDDLDRVYQYPKIAGEFLGLLRTWHEKAKTRPIWERLRLILVHTKEYALLDINQSPFNAGIAIELPEFSLEQVKELAKRHKLNWDTSQVDQLMDMVGGHPYLVQEALKQITRWGMTLEELLETAPTEAGIYGDLLQEHLWNLQQNRQKYPKLNAALEQVITANDPVKLEPGLALKLDELGLVKWQDNGVKSRYKLYRLYFQERLKDIQ